MLRSIIVHFRLVLQLLCRLTLFITAGAFIDNLARRFTGRSVFNVLEAVRLVHFLVAAAADLFVIDVVALYRLRFPTVCCRVSEGLSAFFAELVAGASVLRLPELNLIVRMVALFYLTTACAVCDARAVGVRHVLPLVVHSQRTVERADTEGRRPIADVHAIGQRIAQCQHIAVLQLIIGKTHGRIIGSAADRVHPAGAACEVKLSQRGAVIRIEFDICPLYTAPKRGIGAVFAERAVDPRQNFFFGRTVV